MRLMVLLIAFGILLMATGAMSAIRCETRADIVDGLARAYNEKPERIGLLGNGNILEIFSAPSGTFSILVSKPNGNACLIASGEGWSTPMKSKKGDKT